MTFLSAQAYHSDPLAFVPFSPPLLLGGEKGSEDLRLVLRRSVFIGHGTTSLANNQISLLIGLNVLHSHAMVHVEVLGKQNKQ